MLMLTPVVRVIARRLMPSTSWLMISNALLAGQLVHAAHNMILMLDCQA